MGLEVEAQVEERFAQGTVYAEVEGHEQATDAAVAVQEGVDGLELDVKEAGLDEGRETGLPFVHEPLERIEAGVQLGGGRRHKKTHCRDGSRRSSSVSAGTRRGSSCRRARSRADGRASRG